MPVQRETTCAMRSGVTTSCAIAPPFVFVLLHLLQLAFEVRDHAIGKLACLGEIAAPLRLLELDAGGVELLFQLLRAGELGLLVLPAACDRIRFLFEIDELLLQPSEPVFRGGVGLLLQRLALDLELDDAPVELVELLGLGVDLHAQARRRLVDEVDRLVGQEAVGDVAVGQAWRP